jgi:predicted RNA-binding protein YlxR (DUF448 family)
MQKNSPTRMCIACRTRESQNDLIRLQLMERDVVPFSGAGRSFYLCHVCVANEKRIRGIARRLGVESDVLRTTLKEFTTDGEN